MNRDLLESKIKSLVSKFEANKYHYLSKNYLEEEVKIDFINPLFEALGWDIGNTQGLSPYERDVVVEKGETLGHPDYNFRIDGQTKFFIEAKAPHKPLHKINHVLQAKSYAWNTKSVFIVLLTDFEEFRLFDATIKPDPKNADQGLIFELTYDQYLENLDKLILLSKEEVEKGSLDKLLLKDSESKKLRKPVDEAFLEDISNWREELAKDIYKNNIKDLEDTTDEGRTKIQVKILNEAVQKILDRLIFIRIAEDRRMIEPKSLLDDVEWWKAGGKRRDLQRRLINRFMGWNQDFNGEILKPGPCDVLEISSGLLAKIIEGLYFPKCPYRFEVIGVELLGSIYERYLGKTIRVTPKRIKIEEKPEVRKAGGVYYTPQYIVDYIVKHTVREKIEGKTPKQIEGIRILDPACGSGSFLLAAYQTLIDYHLDYLEKHPEEAEKRTLFPDVITSFSGIKKLSIEKKAQILRNNIFGVDIDPQAVEISMMSLYLKCLEGEKDLPRKQELLPSLTKNIRCGNSLISFDIFNQMCLFDEEEKDHINPFDWHSKSTGFGAIMEQGGFDAIVGNPPYLRIQGLQEYYGSQIDYLKKEYKAAIKRFDLYLLFAEKGFKLLNLGGKLGFICPHKFINSDFGSGLRKFFIENSAIDLLINFGNNLIFKQASTYTGILFLTNKKKRKFKYCEISEMPILELPEYLNKLKQKDFFLFDFSTLNSKPWILTPPPVNDLLSKIMHPPFLGDVFKTILVGVQSGIDDIHILELISKDNNKVYKLFSKRADAEVQIEASLLKPLLKGEDVHRFANPVYSHYIIYPYEIKNDKTRIIEESDLKIKCPLGYKYLNEYRKELTEIRKRQKTNPSYWYSCHRPRQMNVFEKQRIITPEISLGCNMTLAPGGIYTNTQVYNLLPNYSTQENLKFWLGVLNSKILWWFLSNTGTILRGGYFRFKKNYLDPFPIRLIDFSNKLEIFLHNEIVSSIDRLLQLNNVKAALPPSSQKNKTEREIQITNEKVDELVYELYGITEEEIKIIEEGI